jgi:preprotein translocase subunit Sss1
MPKVEDHQGERRPAVAKKPSRDEEVRQVIREYIEDQLNIIRTLRRWLN